MKPLIVSRVRMMYSPILSLLVPSRADAKIVPTTGLKETNAQKIVSLFVLSSDAQSLRYSFCAAQHNYPI